MKKVLVFGVLIVSLFLTVSSAQAGLQFDLKGGLIGSGGFGLGGGVIYPLNKNFEIRSDIYYASLGGFTGAFYPIMVNGVYRTQLFNLPVYAGGGINYFLGSPKKNNVDSQGGIGVQGMAGLEYPLMDNLSLAGELGMIMVQAKQTGGNFVASYIGAFTIGLKYSPFEEPAAPVKKSVERATRKSTAERISRKAPQKPTEIVLEKSQIKTGSTTLSYGKKFAIKVITPTDAEVNKVAIIFKNGKSFALKKTPYGWAGNIPITKASFKRGKQIGKIYIKQYDGTVETEQVSFTVK